MHIEHRIKSMRRYYRESLKRKIFRFRLESIRQNLFDIAGVKAICAYLNDVYEFAEYIEMQPDIKIIRIKDYIKSPKVNGYRSLHLIIEIPVNFLEARQYLPVEIQLKTSLWIIGQVLNMI